MIFRIFPTNIIAPLFNNDTAQLVIIGLVTGAAFLVSGDGVDELKRIIEQLNKVIMNVMSIVLLTTPAIPFLSMFITLARGNGKELLSGGSFVVASYLIFTVCLLLKAIKIWVKTGIKIPELWNKILPVAKITFKTGSTTAATKSVYEASDNFGIKKSFSSFWIPMGSAMLSPKTTINVVIAMFMAAKLENMPISLAFILVLIIMTTELSVASPGVNAAVTVVLQCLGLPVDYVGLVSTYRMLTDNYGATCALSYNVLEELEMAYKLGEIETKTEEEKNLN